MSRHLMAKMRRHANDSVGWRTGPSGWRDWAIRPEVGADTHYFGEPWRQHNFPEEHQSVVVHHGEQRYALEIMPVRNREPRPNKEPGPLSQGADWSWGIFKHDHTNPDKQWRFPADWAYGSMDEPPGKYYGFTKNPEEAKNEAERNWELHKQHVDSGNPIRAGGDDGGYDINDIMRRFDRGEL